MRGSQILKSEHSYKWYKEVKSDKGNGGGWGNGSGQVVVGSQPLHFYSSYKEKKNTLYILGINLMLKKKQEIYLDWVAHGDQQKFMSSNQMFEFS